MAKKVNLNDLVTGTKTPSWARAAREDFLRKEKEREGARANREQEALLLSTPSRPMVQPCLKHSANRSCSSLYRLGELNFPVSTAQEAPVLPEAPTTITTTGPGIATATYVPTSEARPTTSIEIFDRTPTGGLVGDD